MKDIANIIHDLATLYGIEILNEPTGHIFVDENGVESALKSEDFKKVFRLPGERISSFGFQDIIGCESIHHEESCLLVGNGGRTVFNTANVVQSVTDDQYQYPMAA